MNYGIYARVKGGGGDSNVVGCFDPTIVVCRLRVAFPELQVVNQDFAWRDYDLFQQRGICIDALNVSESDARRRGPHWKFSLPLKDGTQVKGRAERYLVEFRSDFPIPEPLRWQILAAFEQLKFSTDVEVGIE